MPTIRDRRWNPTIDKAPEMWTRLTDGWREVVGAFAALLPLQLRTIEFTGPIASLAFETPGIDRRPRAVIMGDLFRLDTGATSAISFSWTYDQGMITTTSFSGLAATQWRATFLVIGA